MNAQDQTKPNGEQKPVEITPKRQIKPVRGKSPKSKRPLIASEDLPKKTLEDSLTVSATIKDNYGKAGAAWEQIASAMHTSASNVNSRYLLWSATAYGIITKEEDNYKLSETGRRILAPTYDGEDREGKIKAITTPSILARFYSDYSSSPLPQGDIFKNVLEQKYGIPSKRIDETVSLILANARYAKLLEEQPDGRMRLLSPNIAVGVGGGSEQKLSVPTNGNEASHPTSGTEPATEYSKACFVITPIGDEGSPERKHADAMLRHLITPVLEQFSIVPIRADKIVKPGHMTKQMVEHIAFSKLCITDISFGNQNAGYELGIRHTLKLPRS